MPTFPVSRQFIHDHRRRYPVELMCQILQVSRSGYYAWRKRKPSARKMANETLLALIRLHYRRNKGVYGSPRTYSVQPQASGPADAYSYPKVKT